jgi:AcrR family transcriptional regulator
VTLEVGLRERKKQRTRQALIDTAVRLFEERGYDQTTIADIAAGADVSTRTFFLHFPTKEAVVFANDSGRVDVGLAVIASRRPSESARQVLLRAMEQMIDDVAGTDLLTGLGSLRARLLLSTPALQEAMVRRLVATQAAFVEAIQRAYPAEFDEIESAAIIGAVVGAIYGAVVESVRRGDSPAELRQTMLRAARIAVRCIPAVRGRSSDGYRRRSNAG